MSSAPRITRSYWCAPGASGIRDGSAFAQTFVTPNHPRGATALPASAIKEDRFCPTNRERIIGQRGRLRLYPDDHTKWRELKRRQRHPEQRHICAPQTPGFYRENLADLLTTGERFGTIYADPPWPYEDDPPYSAAVRHYPLMSLEAICALPVRDLAADQAHLHLWVTNGFLLTGCEF
jgi:hypothetical protein